MGFKLASGDTPLAGYTIRRGLGLGGFGEVYFAVSEAGKEVALKRIHRNLNVEFRGAQQCLNLRHPNLVALYDIRPEDDEQGWIVMEYIAGETLKDCLDRAPHGLPEEETLRLFGQIGAAVCYLHDQGIVHRDLKPANVFLDHGLVKIGDYGLSKFISASKRAGQTESVGTFHYMAPEIGNGDYGKEIDIYALGIILYELLTGSVPFDGESSQEIIMKHLTCDPDLSRLTPRFRQAVGKALAKDPSQRFRSVREMLEAIGIAIDESGMAVRPAQATLPAIEAKPPTLTPRPLPHRFYREPIANAIASGVASMQRTIERVPYGSPVFIALMLALGLALSVFGVLLIPHAIFLGSVYLVYFAIWSVIYGSSSSNASPVVVAHPGSLQRPVVYRDPKQQDALRVPDAEQGVIQRSRPVHRPLPFAEWQAIRRQELANQPWTLHWREWTQASLRSAMCLFIIAILGYLVAIGTDFAWSNSNEFIAVGTWTVLMTLVTTWTVLFFSKAWERQPEDSLMYRFVLVACGLAIGSIGYVAGLYLHVPWESVALGRSMPSKKMWGGFYVGQSPAWPAFVVYFAILMGAIRWWRQADSLRRSRFSLFSLAWTVVVAGLISSVVFFPTPWCLMVAGGTSLLVQLATKNANVKDRPRFVAVTS